MKALNFSIAALALLTASFSASAAPISGASSNNILSLRNHLAQFEAEPEYSAEFVTLLAARRTGFAPTSRQSESALAQTLGGAVLIQSRAEPLPDLEELIAFQAQIEQETLSTPLPGAATLLLLGLAAFAAVRRLRTA